LNEEEGEEETFDWKDLIAFIIALLQTGLLPVVFLLISIIIVAIILLVIGRYMVI